MHLDKTRAYPHMTSLQVRKNKYVEIVPLSTGCLGACTYCKTVHARGKLGSYDPEALLRRVAQASAQLAGTHDIAAETPCACLPTAAARGAEEGFETNSSAAEFLPLPASSSIH